VTPLRETLRHDGVLGLQPRRVQRLNGAADALRLADALLRLGVKVEQERY
jgi:hypothetical protein